MRHAVGVLLALAVLLSAASAGAQGRGRTEPEPPGVAVRLSPYDAPAAAEGVEDPGARYLYVFELAPSAWPTAEVVADRRLLRFTVHPEGSRRRYRCRHPDAPRRSPEGRVMRIGAGTERPVWREWIDLRMYCWGRALRALDEGARVEVEYGFRRRGRNRWVARQPDGEEEARSLEGTELEVSAAPEPAPAEGPIRVEMRPANVGSGDWLSFSIAIRANEGTQRVYLRDDLVSFLVDGPLGRATCAVPRENIVPIIDFYKRLRGRAAARTSIAAERWCPEGTFDVAGVYDVTPVVDLVYGGERYDIEAVTGRFQGRPTPVRVRRGEHEYLEQVPEGESPPAAPGSSS